MNNRMALSPEYDDLYDPSYPLMTLFPSLAPSPSYPLHSYFLESSSTPSTPVYGSLPLGGGGGGGGGATGQEVDYDALNTSSTTLNGTLGIFSSTVDPANETDSAWMANRKETYRIMMPIMITCTVAMGLVSLVVVAATPWVKRPLSPTVRFSLSLAAANVVVCATITASIICNSYLPAVFEYNVPICIKLSIETLRLGSMLVQVFHLVVVAFNHYIGVLKPLHYAATMTPATQKVILVILWISPIAGLFISFGSIKDQGYQSHECDNNYFLLSGITFRIVYSCLFFGPLLLLSVIYCHIFYLLGKRDLTLVSDEQRNNLQRNIKAIKTTALIVGTFLLGWTPAVLAFILICEECVIKTKMEFAPTVAIFTTVNVILLLKVWADTFIYALRLKEIRRALRPLLKRFFWKPRRENFGGSRTTYVSVTVRNSSLIAHSPLTVKSSPPKPVEQQQQQSCDIPLQDLSAPLPLPREDSNGTTATMTTATTRVDNCHLIPILECDVAAV
ncbi:uncharacterized protein LOC143032993 [Oratosquilla oratoria]|uniref:uncharacterized protein LOC143032993 n=1 Tax=Oratosquilla oratoria TaxID=337810 RepID=UPI003F774033